MSPPIATAAAPIATSRREEAIPHLRCDIRVGY
jgi:hypothetical protein